jgi:iron complex transport system substrate-binding protein
MLFAIGAGAQVVGVSSFDTYPPEVRTRTRVGALVDPDLERILSLRPDLVVVYSSQQELRQQLARAGIAMFECSHGGLASVTETLESLGRATGHAIEAAARVRELEQRLAAVRARVAGRPRPRTLLVFGRDPLALRNVYASGGVGFLHDMLVSAGADNVLADVARENVQATSELILARAPDVIVELKYGTPVTETELARERAVWKTLPAVPAVRAGRVVMLVGDEFVVPGPRVADATERLARTLHPDAF